MKKYLFLSFLVFVFIGLKLIASPPDLSFIEIPKKALPGKLKSIAYATIRTSILHKYLFTDPHEIKYAPCSAEFPPLPGDFPCSLLIWDDEVILIEDKSKTMDAQGLENIQNANDELGGNVSIYSSKSKSPNMNGTVLLLGEEEDAIKLFYDKENHLSHYFFQKSVVIFRWKKADSYRSLIGIVILKLDADYFPLSGSEISLTNP